MSFSASLSSCWAKLRHAQAHRKKLNLLHEQYFAEILNRPSLLAQRESTDDYHVFRITSVPEVSQLEETMALIVGDCVHNIRSALDYLAFQLALVNKDGKVDFPRQVQFPIVERADGFVKEAKKRLSEVRQDHQNVIEGYQPYHGTAGRPDRWSGPYIHPLSLLQQLSNLDKHRLLNPILLIPNSIEFHLPHDIKPSIPKINSLEDFHVSNPFRNAGEKLEIDTEVYRGKLIGIDVPDTIPNAGHIIPQIALEEKRPISPTLERIENFVSLIIKDFKERLFL